MKRFAIITVLALFCVVVALGLVDSRYYGSFAESYLSNVAMRNDIRISSGETRLGIRGLEVRELEVFFGKLLMGIKLDWLNIKPVYRGFFRLKPFFSMEGAGYNGAVSGFWEQGSLSPSNARAGLALDHIDISLHPNLAGLGVVSGELNLVLSEFVLERGVLERGEALLLLNDLSKPKGTAWNGAMVGLPFNLQIPAFKKLNLAARLDIQPNRVSVKKLVSSSSLHQLSGFGEIIRQEGGQLGDLMIDLKLNLHGQGREVFGPWLAMASKTDPEHPAVSYRIQISGTFRRPDMQVKADR